MAILILCRIFIPTSVKAVQDTWYTAVNGDGATTSYKINHEISTGNFHIDTNHLVYEVTGDFNGIISVGEGVTTTLVMAGSKRESNDSAISKDFDSSSPLQL